MKTGIKIGIFTGVGFIGGLVTGVAINTKYFKDAIEEAIEKECFSIDETEIEEKTPEDSNIDEETSEESTEESTNVEKK